MNVYIWNNVRKCSNSYHSSGGVVVFAETLDEAVALANAQQGCAIESSEAPDEVRQCADGSKNVYIMPDAGCC